MTEIRRRASKGVALSASFLVLAAGVAGCGEDKNEYQSVCINPETNERIPDDECDDDRSSGGYLGFVPVPYFYSPSFGGRYPGVGERVNGGSRSLPKGSNVSVGRGNVSSTGGSAAKAVRGGGFGGGSKASG